MDYMVSWLIQRMEWVYGFIVYTLHLPSAVGYLVLGLLIAIFFYDLYHIYKNRHKGSIVVWWLVILLLVPLGSLLYLFVGRQMLNNAAEVVPEQPPAFPANFEGQPSAQMPIPSKRSAASTLGMVVGVIALVCGAIAVFFFIMITIAMIQCSNDPKCM